MPILLRLLIQLPTSFSGQVAMAHIRRAMQVCKALRTCIVKVTMEGSFCQPMALAVARWAGDAELVLKARGSCGAIIVATPDAHAAAQLTTNKVSFRSNF